MTRRVLGARLLVGAVVAGAVLLWWGVLQRIVQMVVLYWKVGDGHITAGTTALVLLLTTSASCAIIGFALARAAVTQISRVAKISAVAALSAGVLWAALVASPLVDLVRR